MRSTLLGATCVGLTSLIAMRPVIAAECTPAPASFSPGHWTGHASYVGAEDSDGYSTIHTDRFVSFDLDVTAEGSVTGALSLGANGALDSQELDLYSNATWSVDADLTGVASRIQADGEFHMEMQALIGIAGEDGVDPLGGPRYMGHDGQIDNETSFQFEPQDASCSVAVGDFGDNFEVPDGGDRYPLTWIAFRHGERVSDDDISRRYNDVVAMATDLLGGDDVIDVGTLTHLVSRLIGLNNVLAQPAYCTAAPKELRLGSHANTIARQLLGAALTHAAAAALEGAYSTADLVTIMTLGLQAAALDGNRCGVDPDQAYADRAELMHMFETALEMRLEDARERGDQAEIDRILAAAYQFGFFGLLEA